MFLSVQKNTDLFLGYIIFSVKVALFRDPSSIHIKKWKVALTKQRVDVVLVAVERGNRREQPAGTIVITEMFSQNILTRSIRFVLRKLGFEGVIHRHLARQLDRELEKNEIDILHIHSVQFYGQIAAYLQFPRYLVSIYGSDVFHAGTSKQTVEEYRRCFGRAMVVESSSTVAARVAQERYRFDTDKIRVFIWGVDLSRFNFDSERRLSLREKYGIAPEDTVVYAHRSLNPIYNYRSLLDAMRILTPKYPNLRFILIKGNGRPENVEYTRGFIQENALGNTVLFFDQYVADEQIVEFYQVSDAFISIPTTDNIADSLLEGMAMKCYPIVGDVPAYKDLFSPENATIIDDQKDPEKVAKGIEEFLKKEDITGILERNYNFARNQTWDKVAKQQIEIYEEIMNR